MWSFRRCLEVSQSVIEVKTFRFVELKGLCAANALENSLTFPAPFC